MKILLVEPQFPIPKKSKNHKNFLPIGLLKLHDYYKSKGHKVKLVRGLKKKKDLGYFKPDEIKITSLFTYWAKYVKDCVLHYQKLFPDVEIEVGGIYASLHPGKCKSYTGCDKIHIGIHNGAEKYAETHHLNYAKLSNPHPIDYQIIHASRGCPRKCEFCGTWKIEKKIKYKKSIVNEICSNRLVFYDNNLLTNPHIECILKEISEYKFNGKHMICESQSGFDGRILIKKPHLAELLKKARFVNPRIAWDGDFGHFKQIKKQLDILINAGYNIKDIFVFMLYNWDINFQEMERKRIKCWEWGVQISDCRYRPLNKYHEEYSPKKKQPRVKYYIHPSWTDGEIKQFRKNVRQQNICLRQEFYFYSGSFERMKIDKKTIASINLMKRNEAEKRLNKLNIDYWFPEDITYPYN